MKYTERAAYRLPPLRDSSHQDFSLLTRTSCPKATVTGNPSRQSARSLSFPVLCRVGVLYDPPHRLSGYVTFEHPSFGTAALLVGVGVVTLIHLLMRQR